jgi:molybdopterin converting factor small subunit
VVEFTVEFFGLPRRLSGVKETTVRVKAGATLRDVVAALSEMFPAFLGDLVDPQTYDLEEPYFFNIDARHVPRSLDHVPEAGERLLLLFVEAGG